MMCIAEATDISVNFVQLTEEEIDLVSGGMDLTPLAALVAAMSQGAVAGGVSGAANAFATGGNVAVGGIGGMAGGAAAGAVAHLTGK